MGIAFKKKNESFAASYLDNIRQGERQDEVKPSLDAMEVRTSYCTF